MAKITIPPLSTGRIRVERSRGCDCPRRYRRRYPITAQGETLLGKTTVAHAKGTTQTVQIYHGTTKGSETAISGRTVQAYNRFEAIPINFWVHASWVDGGWELTARECV